MPPWLYGIAVRVCSMEKIKLRRQSEKTLLIHNDLFNSAFYFKKRIDERLKNDHNDGIAFDCMACLVMLAFTIEAHVNFLGHTLIANWNELRSFDEKLKKVFRHLKLAPDMQVRPYSSIAELKKFRDTLAHGKPDRIERDEVVEVPRDELPERLHLFGKWEEALEPNAVLQAYEDVDTILRELLEKSGLDIFDTMTYGSSTTTLIGSSVRE